VFQSPAADLNDSPDVTDTVPRMSNYRWQFLLVAMAGWINRWQQDVIAYLMEENRVQRELLGSKRPRFSDEQRRRLAAKAKVLERSATTIRRAQRTTRRPTSARGRR
jgi:hypothetical protein